MKFAQMSLVVFALALVSACASPPSLHDRSGVLANELAIERTLNPPRHFQNCSADYRAQTNTEGSRGHADFSERQQATVACQPEVVRGKGAPAQLAETLATPPGPLPESSIQQQGGGSYRDPYYGGRRGDWKDHRRQGTDFGIRGGVRGSGQIGIGSNRGRHSRERTSPGMRKPGWGTGDRPTHW